MIGERENEEGLAYIEAEKGGKVRWKGRRKQGGVQESRLLVVVGGEGR